MTDLTIYQVIKANDHKGCECSLEDLSACHQHFHEAIAYNNKTMTQRAMLHIEKKYRTIKRAIKASKRTARKS